MNNREKHNYRNIPICDTHYHMCYPVTVASTEKTFRELIEYFELTRITINAMYESDHRPMDITQNIRVAYIKSKLNEDGVDRAIAYGAPVHFYDDRDTQDGYLAQVEELYALGFDGYKMLEGKPNQRKKLGRPICDPIFDKMYAFMEENGLPLKMHLGNPIRNWTAPRSEMSEYDLQHDRWYGDGTFPSLQQLRDEVNEILRKFPRLKLCLAHLYFIEDDVEGARNFLDKWENVSYDITPGTLFAGISKNPDEWKQFFIDYKDRIYFGTDTYNNFVPGDTLDKYENVRFNQIRKMMERTPDSSFEVNGLGTLVPLNLSDEVLKPIYYDNHMLLHPQARKINTRLAKEIADRHVEALSTGAFKYETEELTSLELANMKVISEYYSK